MDGINLILRIITWVLIPVSALLLWSQLDDSSLDSALRGTVAGVVGMVPEGLVLLTSVAFGVAAVTLARRKVLVQELPAVEGPRARRRRVPRQDRHAHRGRDRVRRARAARATPTSHRVLGALAADENRNGTLVALARGVHVARGVDAHGVGAVLLGAQVERRDASTVTARG